MSDPSADSRPLLVFDADCAAVHLKGKNEVWFRPFGLDIPDELGNVCKQVKALLDAEKKQHEGTRNAIFAAPPWTASATSSSPGSALTSASVTCRAAGEALLLARERYTGRRVADAADPGAATAAVPSTARGRVRP